MADSDFSDLDGEEAGPPKNNENEPDTENKTSFRDGLLNFTQRTQRGIGGHEIDRGEIVEPHNDFEKILADMDVSIRRNDADKLYLYLGGLNFAEFSQKINKDFTNSQKRDKAIAAFEKALDDRENLRLYVSPSVSALGTQDTLFRALLSSPHTQVRTFDILMRQIDSLAKGSDEDTKNLSVACVAQVRFLERIVDSGAMYQAIFNRDIEEWTPSTRDYLIEALPEVLTDLVSQQDAALALRDMILRPPSRESLSFRSAIISTLRLLRMPGDMSRKIRVDLCRHAMQFDAPVIPDLVAFCIQTLSYDEKITLRNVLDLLAANVKIDQLRIERSSRRISVDDIVIDVFSKICRFVQLEGSKGWREVTSFLRKSAQILEGEEGSQDGETVEDSGKLFDLFDVLLTFSLISTDGCPPTIMNIFKNQVSSHPERVPEFTSLCKSALQYKKFCSRNLASLTHLAQQCLWSPNEDVRLLGASLYEKFFVTIESSRKATLGTMLGHLSMSEGEAAAILTTLENLVKTHFEELLPFVDELKKCLDYIDILSLNNIKRLYSVLISVYTSDPPQQDIQIAVEQCITKFLSSVSEKERIWGLLGMLMQLQNYMTNKSSNRERKIEELLKSMDKKAKSTKMRSVMYLELAAILRLNIHCVKSSSIISWVENLFQSFRSDFFINRPKNYRHIHELEGEKYADKECTLWINTSGERLIEVVPLFQLLKEAAFVRQRWEKDDDTQLAFTHHFAQLFFAFEANISMDSVSTDITDSPEEVSKSADILYVVIDWIREILNTFSGCDTVEGVDAEEMNAAWVRKFDLLFECQEKLHFHIKALKQWTLPGVASHVDKVVVVAEIPAPKRGRKPTKKAGAKKRKPNEEGETQEEEEEAMEMSAFSPQTKDHTVSFVEKSERIPLASFADRLRPLKFATVVRCLKFRAEKRRATTFLVQQLLKIFKIVLPKKSAKSVPWATSGAPKLDPKFHGDSVHIWKLVPKAARTLLRVTTNIVEYFRDDLNSSDIVDRPLGIVNQTAVLLRECLHAFAAIFAAEDISDSAPSSDRVRDARLKKRRVLMDKLEHAILQQSESQEANEEDSERTVLKFFISAAEVVPNLDVAVALVQTVECCRAWTDDLRETIARHTLAYLKREWSDEEGKSLKGAQLNTPVKTLLDHYIKFRLEANQLSSILWLLANKVAELVPEEERRKSKSSDCDEVDDPGLTEADKRAMFYCFSRGTFGAIFKSLFSSLTNIVQKRIAPREFMRSGVVRVAECVKEWKIASNVFCLLCLMLRVKELRNAGVLLTAVKEGKRFLTLFSKNSSFMHILEDTVRFQSVSSEAGAIIKSVQIGNRSLQNISVYAKTARSCSLLKSLPDLRATSELWMRTVHSAMVNLGCQDAFEIGLLKSRDIDGEEIRNNEDDDESSSERNSPPAGEGEGDDDDPDVTRQSEVY